MPRRHSTKRARYTANTHRSATSLDRAASDSDSNETPRSLALTAPSNDVLPAAASSRRRKTPATAVVSHPIADGASTTKASPKKRHFSAPHSPPIQTQVPDSAMRTRRSRESVRNTSSAPQSSAAATTTTTTKKNGHAAAAAKKKNRPEAAELEEERQSLQQQKPANRSTSATIMTAAWNYDEDDCECGPKRWPGQIDGKQQSPIDLRLSKMKVITLQDPLQFHNYDKPLSGEFVNTGHSVQFIPDAHQTDLPQIQGGMLDQPYKFVQYHYHWGQMDNEGSEHALCGLRYPAELHLVHQGINDPSKLAVLGVFLHLGAEDLALRPDCQVFPGIIESGEKLQSKSPISLESKLPDCRETFARYDGSLTTPPCSENVTWTIFTEPVEVTPKQLELLRAIKDYRGSIIRKNYRPLQSLNDRKVFLASC